MALPRAVYCSLCSKDVKQGKGKTRRKKLFGNSCDIEAERQILGRLIEESGEPRGLKLFHQDATICYECSSNLRKIMKLEAAIKNAKSVIFECVHKLPGTISSHKRSSSTANADLPHAKKKSCTGTASSSSLATPMSPSVCLSNSASSCTILASVLPSSVCLSTSTGSTSTVSSVSDMSSPVHVSFGNRNYNVHTPHRKDAIQQYTRRSYPLFSKTVVNSHGDNITHAIAHGVKEEFDHMSSKVHSSILQNNGEDIRFFSWNKIWLELTQDMPLLTSLLKGINVKENHITNSVVACIFLKQRNKNLCLLQRTVSAFLYANGSPKKVYKCLQPLMICQSYEATLNLVERIADYYDKIALQWRKGLLQYISTSEDLLQDQCFAEFNDSIESLNQSQYSIDSPPCSPCSTCEVNYEETRDPRESQDSTHQDMLQQHEDLTEQDLTALVDVEQYLATMTQQNLAALLQQDFMTPNMRTSTEQDTPTIAEQNTTLIQQDEQILTGRNTAYMTVNDGEVPVSTSEWTGFKIVGDNIDKNFRPTYQRHDNKTISLHAFHMYAVKDRVDWSSLSDTPGSVVEVDKVLINDDDIKQLNKDLVVLVSRVLVQHLDPYSQQKQDVVSHISSNYTKEMSTKSKVVPLGVLQRNENKVQEMCEILDEVHKYVPAKQTVECFPLFHDEPPVQFDDETFHQILFGGDQLTVARVRGSVASRADHFTRRERLEGLLPIVEDWHAKQCLLKAIWKHAYKDSSRIEKGTLSQLKILLNIAASVDPEKNMNGCEDFFLIVLHAYVVAAGRKLLSKKPYDNVNGLAKGILKSFVCFDPNKRIDRSDKCFLYATQILTLALVWLAFNDAVAEGDGDRVLLCWKFLLVIFRVKGQRNYCKEAIILLMQYHCTFSERKAAQLKWSRFINTSGKQGGNIPCDLHLEHLNRRIKRLIRDMAPNASLESTSIYPNNAVNRSCRSIGLLHDICNMFEQENHATVTQSNHNKPSFEKEVKLAADVLIEQDLFERHRGRKFQSFSNLNTILQQCPTDHLKHWITSKLDSYINHIC